MCVCVCVIHFIVLAIKYSAQECTCTWTFLSDPVYGNRFIISKNQTALYSETHDGHKTVSVELKDMQSKSSTHAHTHTLTRAHAHTHTLTCTCRIPLLPLSLSHEWEMLCCLQLRLIHFLSGQGKGCQQNEGCHHIQSHGWVRVSNIHLYK